MRKVDLGVQAIGQELMLGKLLAVVKGQRLADLFVGAQQINDRLRYPSAVLGGQWVG